MAQTIKSSTKKAKPAPKPSKKIAAKLSEKLSAKPAPTKKTEFKKLDSVSAQFSNGQTQQDPKKKILGNLPLEKGLLVKMHDLMVKSRILEERLIKIYKTGNAHFWIGAPGEEAFGVSLGLLADKGQGLDHDWLHLHYRCTPTLVALGMPMIDSIRLMLLKVTDTSTGGRNFSNHYCYPQWNVAPVSSPIEVQYAFAIGSAWAQKREKAKGITIVTGGDAGTAEGDFASCLVWSSRKGNELPILITVQNNRWGISTAYEGQHGEENIYDRGKAFGIRSTSINGNDPIECYLRLQEEMYYIRRNRKPVLLEAHVSRLYGHSSASGANFVASEADCLKLFEEKLLKHDVLKESEITELYTKYETESREITEQVRSEPGPTGDSIWNHIYANNENGDWRKF